MKIKNQARSQEKCMRALEIYKSQVNQNKFQIVPNLFCIPIIKKIGDI